MSSDPGIEAERWNHRFRAQAAWTAELRRYLVYHLGLDRAARLLEVGCGTGVITAGFRAYTQSLCVGLDLNSGYLSLARQNDPLSAFTRGDGLQLPFPDGAFDAVFCHYFLLWVPRAPAALAEMARVTRPGGWVIAFAEPDYGGRVDYPEPLEDLGRLQTAALKQQGANPQRGRELSGLFNSAGLQEVETGVIGGQWQSGLPTETRESEWATLAADLKGIGYAGDLEQLKTIDQQAWESGTRVLFVPTFFAFGQKQPDR